MPGLPGSIFEMTSIDTMKDVFEINFFSTYANPITIKVFKKSDAACIINIGSITLDSRNRNISYGSSKAASDVRN